MIMNEPVAGSRYLELRNVTMSFNRFTALEDVSFDAEAGEFLSILGPSGCGKTTLLRVAAGLEKPDRGTVVIAGRDVSGLPVSKRNVGIVFQSYALFPNLTAEQNIAYGLTPRFCDRDRVRRRVTELLDMVGLVGSGHKYPAQLSGGQQQRVALARAIAGAPALLLLDEPLSALDAKVRSRLRAEIRQLQKHLGITTLMVTHDQEEALAMADRILVMDQGRLLQTGTPDEVYDLPASPFVASFIGSMNFIRDLVKEAPGIFRKGDLSLAADDSGLVPQGTRAILAVRPEDIVLNGSGGSRENALPALVRGMEYRGASYRVTLSLGVEGGCSTLEADVPTRKIRRLGIHENMPVNIGIPVDRLIAYVA
ncbi:putative 2-aminoethylphosphonate ABC transporter ATP-binding protein [Syntrophobacter fumaroxidans]|uniref:ABC transporter related n=1 Tax=Syntrophobacter fumaroxidans (strain DSM 10017 / MPOB) TaxID=335543 RepID=A0LMC3_SYNFM|nr:putative 2-aminoethylphosphonate ABC transporter ATP-binding protein [Syntrophobacter fumaroxidans]ABK18575.1 ABC transporter related [Syntrophobacter fumaroxidans MPOB]